MATMNPDIRQWHWSTDMNGDELVTVSDVWAWVGWLFFYPGDYCLYVISQDRVFASVLESVAVYLGTTPPQYGGLLSFAVSATAWLLMWGVVAVVRADIRERLTRGRRPTIKRS